MGHPGQELTFDRRGLFRAFECVLQLLILHRELDRVFLSCLFRNLTSADIDYRHALPRHLTRLIAHRPCVELNRDQMSISMNQVLLEHIRRDRFSRSVIRETWPRLA